MDCNPPGSFVHRILQTRILGGVAISFSRGSSGPRDRTWVSHVVGRFFTIWAPGRPILWLRRFISLTMREFLHASKFCNNGIILYVFSETCFFHSHLCLWDSFKLKWVVQAHSFPLILMQECDINSYLFFFWCISMVLSPPTPFFSISVNAVIKHSWIWLLLCACGRISPESIFGRGNAECKVWSSSTLLDGVSLLLPSFLLHLVIVSYSCITFRENSIH